MTQEIYCPEGVRLVLNPQDMVAAFHKEFGILINETPTLADDITQSLRLELIREEFKELKGAIEEEDLVAVADGLGDLLYVIYGAGVSFGIDLDPVLREIHRSNMSKIGGYKRGDGKWVKPDTYSPADLESVLDRQRIKPGDSGLTMNRYNPGSEDMGGSDF